MAKYSNVKVQTRQSVQNNNSGWSISRILSSASPRERGYNACAVISLGGASPRRSMQPTRGWLLPQEGGARMEAGSLPSSTDEIAPA